MSCRYDLLDNDWPEKVELVREGRSAEVCIVRRALNSVFTKG
jgi:hypothetical protein